METLLYIGYFLAFCFSTLVLGFVIGVYAEFALNCYVNYANRDLINIKKEEKDERPVY